MLSKLDAARRGDFTIVLERLLRGVVTRFVTVGNDIVAWLHRERNMLAGTSISWNVDF